MRNKIFVFCGVFFCSGHLSVLFCKSINSGYSYDFLISSILWVVEDEKLKAGMRVK